MSKIMSLYVFIVHTEGEERVVLWTNEDGSKVPLVYTTLIGVEVDNMRTKIQALADNNKLYFELREYQLVETEESEVFYPTKEYHA